jgi:hypothetical protein
MKVDMPHFQDIDVVSILRKSVESDQDLFWLESDGKTIFLDERTGKNMSFMVRPSLDVFDGTVTHDKFPTEGAICLPGGTIIATIDWEGLDGGTVEENTPWQARFIKKVVDAKMEIAIDMVVKLKRSLNKETV